MPEQLGLLDQSDASWLDPASDGLFVRQSRRARQLILQIIPPHTLELVVPIGTRPKDVAAFVAENRQWIDKARADIVGRFAGDRDPRPERIELKSIGRSFVVDYSSRRNGNPTCRTLGGRIEISGPDLGAANVGRLLRVWLLKQAAGHLKPWLLREAERLGERPRGVQVRLQRTRWGSCSSQRNVSLNASLLFLEPRVVGYLMVHELSHLRFLNHSERYWRFVERFEPDYRALDRALADAWTELPWWVIEAARPARGVASRPR
jgi:predicted metal-dependent hydrolase